MKSYLKTIILQLSTALMFFSCVKNYNCSCEKKIGGYDNFKVKGTQSKAGSVCQDKKLSDTSYVTCGIAK